MAVVTSLPRTRTAQSGSAQAFQKNLIDVIPRKKIAVDRTKEPGAPGEPLYLDVCKAFFGIGGHKPLIIGGRYGLGSKDTRPSQIVSVFDNLESNSPKDHFTIGIVDDLTNTSLPEGEIIETVPPGTISCKFWGLGSDGTVGANKSAIKIIGDNTDMYAQAYFSYDSKKSGGTTVSHLRFGPKPIRSPYLVYNADYIACHNKSFLYNYDILKGLKKKGSFVLNCPWDDEGLEANLPASIKRYIAQNDIDFYTIDAIAIAGEVGLGNRINMIMQTVFFKLANIIPVEDAIRYLKESIEEAYGKKGRKIVEMNNQAVDRALDALHRVKVPESWANASDESDEPEATHGHIGKSRESGAINEPISEYKKPEALPDFIQKIQRPMARQEGDELPVSAFMDMEDGTHPPGTTAYEKGASQSCFRVVSENCIQCGRCSFVCPHATIRLFLLDENEAANAPETTRR